jgi:hypothetical protein
MFDEVLVNVLEGALELLLGGHHLPGVRQQEAGHLTETGTQVCPDKKNLSKVVLTKEEEKIYLCFFDGQQDERRATETGMQVTF